MCHDWPGNIRELENVIERAVLLSEGPLVTVADLQIGESLAWTAEHDRTPAVRIPPSGISLEEIERQALARSAPHVQLGAEGRRAAARHQPARHELQAQSPQDRDAQREEGDGGVTDPE